MKNIKSLLVMSGVAAAAVFAFAAPAQAHDRDCSNYADTSSSSGSFIDVSLLNGLLGGDSYSDDDIITNIHQKNDCSGHSVGDTYDD